MPDWSILHFLGRERTVLGTKYQVVWDCKDNCAKVLYLRPNETEWLEVDRVFESELKAHGYVNELAQLQPPPDFDWRDYA